MKKIKSFLMALIIIELFVFASCKNNFTPEQAKVVCNAGKTTIKGVAIIEDTFVLKGIIIRLYEFSLGSISLREDIIVSDDEGHFESTNQYRKDVTGQVYFLKIESDDEVFRAAVTNSSAEDAVYDFKKIIKRKIKGVAKLGDAFFIPKGTTIKIRPYQMGVSNDPLYAIECMPVIDHEGHFESNNKYDTDILKTCFLEIRHSWKEIYRAEIKFSTEEIVYKFVLIPPPPPPY